MIENAAVFINSNRRVKGVNVEEISGDDHYITVTHRVSGAEISRFPVIEVAKAGMAWDVMDGDTIRRLVAQQGCGCGGQKSYKVDSGYSGRL